MNISLGLTQFPSFWNTTLSSASIFYVWNARNTLVATAVDIDFTNVAAAAATTNIVPVSASSCMIGFNAWASKSEIDGRFLTSLFAFSFF